MKRLMLAMVPMLLAACAMEATSGGGAAGQAGGGVVQLDQLPLTGSQGKVAARKTPKGTDLMLAGKKIDQGIGVEGNTSIIIDLKGGAKSFSATVGTDKEAGETGAVRFYVIGDGKLLTESGIMKGDDEPKKLEANLTGVKQLVLRTDNVRTAGDANFGNWGNAAVTMASGKPAVVPANQAVPELQVWVDELDLTKSTTGWQETGINVSAEYNPVTLKGKTFLHAVGTHADGLIVIDLKGAAKSFSATIGIDDDSDDVGSANFAVIGDGKVLYASGILRRTDATTKKVQVDLTGVQQLVLKVDVADDGPDHDHTDWAESLITLDPAKAKSRPETVSASLAKLPQ